MSEPQSPEEAWDRLRGREQCPLCERRFNIGGGGLVSHCRQKHICDLIDIAWSVIEAAPNPPTQEPGVTG